MKKLFFILLVLGLVTGAYLYLKTEHYKLECQYKFGDESISVVTTDGFNSCTSKTGLVRMP